jgi:glycosyltransferase involved in cell wall biosynthesis
VLQQVRAAAGFPVDFAGLVRYAIKERVRIVHGTDRPRDAAYTMALSRLVGARSVVHVHVAWALGYSAPARFGVRHADGVFSISRFVTGTIVATGTPAERVHTVLNCVDASRWNPEARGDGIRREFGIPQDALVLASVSRLFAQKGQCELLRAFARVRSLVPNVWLLIVGADASQIHGGSFTAELKALAHELGVADRVIFTGERSDIQEIMASCDVYTMPSSEEPFGLVYLEAMAMKKPVVSLDNGGTPEVVEHGQSGLLAPGGDLDALTTHIVTLLEDAQLRARMGDYGRRRVLEYFNAERMARDAGRAYEDILDG